MSRKLMLAILTALPLVGGSLCAMAQTTAPTSRPSFFQHMLQKMDTNGDGKISLDEYLAAAANRFKAIDTQNKSSIDAADITASPAMIQRDQKMAQFMIKRLDTAGNGYVTRDEFLAAAKTRFARMDSTNSGQVTLGQFEAAVPGRRWHGAAAQVSTTGTDKHARFQNMAQRAFDKLDANHDGVVTLDEYLAAAGTRFDKLDAAHTGKLTAQQIATSPKMLRRDEFAAQRELRRMGAGPDGSVTQDQYLAAAKARFAILDANGDGFLEADEVTGRHWARGTGTRPAND